LSRGKKGKKLALQNTSKCPCYFAEGRSSLNHPSKDKKGGGLPREKKRREGRKKVPSPGGTNNPPAYCHRRAGEKKISRKW